MADVPFTIAVIGIVAPVVAGGIPVIAGWIRDSGRDRRDRAERIDAERVRLEREKREACVKLLRMARDFRVLVENTCDSRGPDLATHARKVRQSAADITGQADEVGFMVFVTETAANALAAEARILAATIADSKNRELGASLLSPNFTRFDQCVDEFKVTAQGASGYLAASTAESADSANGERLGLQATVESSAVPGQFQG
ncbi:MAG TPA: hypothetical protein VGG16_23635 [Streptosporangiaceae bacterium]|jgi:hypothetical protein